MRAPLTVLDIDDDQPRDLYGYDLLLLRPDLHVVWRGNRLPDDAAKMAAVATGHSSGSVSRFGFQIAARELPLCCPQAGLIIDVLFR